MSDKQNGDDGALALKGQQVAGTQRTIDGGKVLKSAPHPLAFERAFDLVTLLEKIEDLQNRATEMKSDLAHVLVENRVLAPMVRVQTRRRIYVYHVEDTTELVCQKEKL